MLGITRTNGERSELAGKRTTAVGEVIQIVLFISMVKASIHSSLFILYN